MHRLDQITNTGERGSLKPGCLVTRRNYAGYEPLLLLREPTACTLYHMIVIKKSDITGTLHGSGFGIIIAIVDEWAFVLSHDGMGWCNRGSLVLQRVV